MKEISIESHDVGTGQTLPNCVIEFPVGACRGPSKGFLEEEPAGGGKGNDGVRVPSTHPPVHPSVHPPTTVHWVSQIVC